jgi:hypothetical protein
MFPFRVEHFMQRTITTPRQQGRRDLRSLLRGKGAKIRANHMSSRVIKDGMLLIILMFKNNRAAFCNILKANAAL